MKTRISTPLSLFLVLLIVAGCGYHNPNMLPADK